MDAQTVVHQELCRAELRFPNGLPIPPEQYTGREEVYYDSEQQACVPGDVYCDGPGIAQCLNQWMYGSPSIAAGDTRSVQIGADYYGLGEDRSYELTWSGDEGFRKVCRDAARQAVQACTERNLDCREAAGGCS